MSGKQSFSTAWRMKTCIVLLTNDHDDAREIRQSDSHKETTETQTVAAPVLGLVC